MKKKSVNMILLVGVIAIWGIVISRFFKGFFSESATPVFVNQPRQQLNLDRQIEKESFELTLLERDPFLNKISSKKKVVVKHRSVNRKPISKTKNVAVFNWPRNMEYYGFLKSGNSSHSIAMLRVDGTFFKVKESEEIQEGLYVKIITRDSVVLSNSLTDRVLLKK